MTIMGIETPFTKNEILKKENFSPEDESNTKDSKNAKIAVQTDTNFMLRGKIFSSILEIQRPPNIGTNTTSKKTLLAGIG
jgi:hypothetical protein